MTFAFIIMCERIHSVVFVALCSSQYIKYEFGSDLSRFHSLFLYIDIHVDMVKGRISL